MRKRFMFRTKSPDFQDMEDSVKNEFFTQRFVFHTKSPDFQDMEDIYELYTIL